MCLISEWTPQAYRSPMGVHRHVGLRWGISVSDQVCQSPMKHVEISDGSPIRHIGVRYVSDDNNIFVNSIQTDFSAPEFFFFIVSFPFLGRKYRIKR